MVVAEGSGGGTHRWRRRGAGGGRRNATRERMRRVKWLWTVRVYPHLRLSSYAAPFPSSFLLAAYEALARGELHNSWPYYTPTAASPAYPLYRGPPPSPNPSCTTELSLRASTFSFFLAGVSLSRVHCTSPLYARAFNPMHTKESMCARV